MDKPSFNISFKPLRKTVLALTAIAGAFWFTGCLPAAKTAVINFQQHMVSKDYEGAKRYATEALGRKIDAYQRLEAIAAQGIPSMSDYQALAGQSDVMALALDINTLGGLTFVTTETLNQYSKDMLKGSTQNGTIRVWHKDSDYIVFILIKENGKWKVDHFDLSKLTEQSSQYAPGSGH